MLIPECADQFVIGGLVAALNTLAQLPDEIAHEHGDVDRVLPGAGVEVVEKPIPGLIVDQLVEMSDPGFA